MQTDNMVPRPCPFCGSVKLSVQYGADAENSGIFCTHCKALVRWPIEAKSKKETYRETLTRWLKKWNARKETER